MPEEPDALAADGFVTGGADCDLKPSSSTSTATVLVTARMTRRMRVSEALGGQNVNDSVWIWRRGHTEGAQRAW